MKFTSFAALAAAGALVATGAAAQTRDTIQIAGSSTVLPFASVVAEEFGNAYPEFNTPVVGSGGSSGGLRQFCAGVGENTIDIANASRQIRQNEIDACAEAGVEKIVEVKIGYDGIVFASDIDTGRVRADPGADLPGAGRPGAGRRQACRQPVHQLERDRLRAAGPGHHPRDPGHQSRHARSLRREGGPAGLRELRRDRGRSADSAEETCLSLRQDGRVIEVAGDYTETLGRLDAQPNAIGVFGLSFYDQNRDRLQVATVDGVEPSMETIATGEYPVSRPLFFYIKAAHIGAIPGLQDYALFFVSEDMSGEGSQLSELGLIPLSADEREAQIDKIESQANVAL